MSVIAVIELGQFTGIQPLLIAVAFALLVLLFNFRSQVQMLVNLKTTRVFANEEKLLEVTNAMTAEMQLLPLLKKVVESITDILEADRSSLFLYDSKNNELWSQVAEGLKTKEIRFPSHIGMAGSVFTSGETVNIKDVYKDDRFNQAVDKKTGYRTKSMLCIQLKNKHNQSIGVVQVLNKIKGSFTKKDEKRLRAFSAKAAIAIENSQLFETVQRMKNYNEAMLESMKSGILTTDEVGLIVKANSKAINLLGIDSLEGVMVDEIFVSENEWIAKSVKLILNSGGSDETLDALLQVVEGEAKKEVSVNLLIQPLLDANEQGIGCLMIFEDITYEKRLRSTMARFLPKEITDKLLQQDQSLGGSLQNATVLFSDIRRFTGFSERNGPQETVRMLNAYFSVMYEQITNYKGILDKYIGDAIMAVFGVPFSNEMDANNAVHAAIQMMAELKIFNETRKENDLESIEIGIGINTDEVVCGNIGSEKRMDFTVIGDGVNLAARLEGATKVYKTPVLISHQTKMALTEEFEMRELDYLRVKGKEMPVPIYELLEIMEPSKRAKIRETLPTFKKGLGFYREQQWESAISCFSAVLEVVDDQVSQMYIARCKDFTDQPPAENWDGAWDLLTK